MVLDAGVLKILRGHNEAENGDPVRMVYDIEIFRSYYGEKTVGIQRFYTAKSVDRQADLLVEIQRCGAVLANKDVCRLKSFKDSGISGDYKILQAQQVLDEGGIPMTDLTLQRINPIEEGEEWKTSNNF